MPKRTRSQQSSRPKARRTNRRRWLLFSVLVAGIAVLRLLWSQPEQGVDNVNLLLGNPTGAIASVTHPNNYLIVRPQYVLSYNRDRGMANWVSWQLDQTWLGDRPRLDFQPDTTLPEQWYHVMPNDYRGSGFDRGHLVPAADRNQTEADSEAVFLMTNIMPQAPDNNRGAWGDLESYCRELVNQGNELYIVAGGIGAGGTGERGRKTAIAGGNVTVPATTWKIAVVLESPGLGLNGITEATRVIAVAMPNQQDISTNWRDFRTSVDELEALTSYDFMTTVPESIQAVIEANVDNQ